MRYEQTGTCTCGCPWTAHNTGSKRSYCTVCEKVCPLPTDKVGSPVAKDNGKSRQVVDSDRFVLGFRDGYRTALEDVIKVVGRELSRFNGEGV